MTARVGIIGYPLGHSVSPIFQQAAFDHLGIDARYEAWPTSEVALKGRVENLRVEGVLGANVTVPYKQAVMPLLDMVESGAKKVGAVNTIINRDGQLVGLNTDATGFMRSLEEEAGCDPSGKRILVIGAGGAARAVAFGLASKLPQEIFIVNRTPERAIELAEVIQRETGVRTVGVGFNDLPPDIAYPIIVHCSTVGMAGGPDPAGVPPTDLTLTPDVLVCDLVYNPRMTPLLRMAQEKGAQTLGGLGMLVYQGAAAFELWTQREAPIDIMYAAAEEALD